MEEQIMTLYILLLKHKKKSKFDLKLVDEQHHNFMVDNRETE